ncbi:MAG: cation-translocating P-type ATPase [Saprospiraceae bacterium]|nr:cation-translocating P-type ATPase [Saprospiraceae bacterium]
MSSPLNPLSGLSPAEVIASRQANGANYLYVQPARLWWHRVRDVLSEPMVLLLLIACVLYFAIGDPVEGWFMAGAILFVVLIDVVQDYRSERALQTLRRLSQPRVTVIRDGRRQEVPAEEIVVNDLIAFAEGERIAADAQVVQQNDLSVDESILTGESMPVFKRADDRVYQGSTVNSGAGVGRVAAVGAGTELGKLGRALETIETEPTPLQRKIDRFVRQMMLAGLGAFLIVLAVNMVHGYPFWSALLYSLALAMALIPEEIPVAFSSFMALGAYRMTRQSVLVKQPRTVESLGSATVICLDKTGTITENHMAVAAVHDFSKRGMVIASARRASEPEPFDAMERAICDAWEAETPAEQRKQRSIMHEYPLEGAPPMMTHVYHSPSGSGSDVYAKGAVERILKVCKADIVLENRVMSQTREMAAKGWRVLGVASADWPAGQPFPEQQDDFSFAFEGLVALYDPPKGNIREVMDGFYQAGVDVKMVTGDFPETALYIARESGIRLHGDVVTGEQVGRLTEQELRVVARQNTVFARMFPQAKLRLVDALKADGAVVAMTGDGVNDGPALKSAQVGVAMGRRGAETARAAASMVLLDDDLAHLVVAVQTGRRIYNNLRKAIRYILSIHLPIVLVVVLPLVLGWPYLHLFTPLHVIFLELVMGPTCAIAYENEPGEPDGSRLPPRTAGNNLFSGKELLLSMVQGLAITAGLLFMYQWGIHRNAGEASVRSYVFVTLLSANVFLTLVNRSFVYTLAQTLLYRNPVIWIIIGFTALLTTAILLVQPVRDTFDMAPLRWAELGLCLATALVSVLWFEGWKLFLNVREQYARKTTAFP